MTRKLLSLTLLAVVCLCGSAIAQNFKGKQKEQEKTIKTAYKAKKLSDREYEKLMAEQELIKNTIEKYELDDVWTSKEKNQVHDKLVRASKRLQRYKTNGEIY